MAPSVNQTDKRKRTKSTHVVPITVPESDTNIHVPCERGQIARPQPVLPTSMASVAELVHDVIPHASNGQTPYEKIEWLDLQKCQIGSDSSQWFDYIVMGLTRGFQIWMLDEESNWEEVLSERRGPIRLGKLLPLNPEPLIPGQADPHASKRPFFAYVENSSAHMDRPYCELTFQSLIKKEIVRCQFEEPICSIHHSTRFVVVGLQNSAVVLDATRLEEKYRFPTAPPLEGCPPAIALSSTFLAFSDIKVENQELSRGGADFATEHQPTYTSQMLQVISRTMSSLNETVVSSKKAVGVVSVIDLLAGSPIARWVAHLAPISHLSFSPDSRCVMTADDSASVFHVFLLLPHPALLALSSVQHLYKLHRGSTPAKVLSSCWSLDGRWLCVSTNHGTTHVFAVCPYGGAPTQRTHNGRLTNRESKFLRSAGLTEDIGRERTLSGSPVSDKKQSNEKECLIRSSLNPRVGLHPPPVTLTTAKKIRENRLANHEYLAAWATDLTPSALLAAPKTSLAVPASSRVSVLFTDHQHLLIAKTDGAVCAYELSPRRGQSAEDAPRLDVAHTATWTLTRTRDGTDVRLPLSPNSTLMSALVEKRSRRASGWIPQVETNPYCPPIRRLWQGPQFSFFCYNEEKCPELMTPSNGPQKSVPVVIGGSHEYIGQLGDATRIECGSWTSESECRMNGEDDVSILIAEAMKDVQVHDEQRDSGDEFFDTCGSGRRLDDDLVQFDSSDHF